MPAENGKYTLALFALAAAASIRFVYQQRFAPIQQPYEYPLTPGDAQWSELPTPEKRKLCQLDPEILKRLTTPALAEAFWTIPILWMSTPSACPAGSRSCPLISMGWRSF